MCHQEQLSMEGVGDYCAKATGHASVVPVGVWCKFLRYLSRPTFLDVGHQLVEDRVHQSIVLARLKKARIGGEVT